MDSGTLCGIAHFCNHRQFSDLGYFNVSQKLINIMQQQAVRKLMQTACCFLILSSVTGVWQGMFKNSQALLPGNQPLVLFAILTKISMTGTSVSTPTMVASAAGLWVPNKDIATATASSKKLEAPIIPAGAAMLWGSLRAFAAK
jgi:hypothetical protein